MQRIYWAALACLLTATAAQAQQGPNVRPGGLGPGTPGPFARPYTLSPYLNLLGNNNPAVNYYLRVLPEFERRTQDARVDATLYNLEQRTAVPDTADIEKAIRNLGLSTPLDGTGHAVQFDNLRPYFNQQRPGRR